MKIINVPKVLREKLGDDGVEALLELINLADEKMKENIIEIQTEKYERRLTEEISRLRSEDLAKLDKRVTEVEAKLDKRINETEVKLDKRITEVEARLKVEISRTYANIIKWMFIFWALQIGVITAILFTFLKFIR